jgi:hypothetical protein
VAQLKKISGVSRVSLLGTRLGGTLALEASQQVGVKRIVLWDALSSGELFVQQMENAHRLMLKRMPDEAPFASRQKNPDQCCGFPWPLSLRQEFARIRPEHIDTAAARINHVQTESGHDFADIHDRWQKAGKKVERAHVAEAMNWDHDLYMKIRAVPQQSLRALLQIFEEG